MKKLMLLLLTLPFVFASCGSDDDENPINLKSSEATLNYSKTFQIEATSESEIVYTSENEYHARVSESGLVTAGRIGETNILLTSGNRYRKFKVTIEPQSNLYPEPNLQFGISRSDLIKKLGKPDAETEDAIGYDDYSPNAPMVMYIFDDNSKLESSTVMVKTAYSSELGTFLAERYVYAASIDESYALVLINALKPEDATMFIGAMLYNTSYWMTMYASFDYDKSKSVKHSSNMQRIHELMKLLN